MGGMGLTSFTVTAAPGVLDVTVDDHPVQAQRVVVDTTVNDVPVMTVWTAGPGDILGEGVVQVVRDPTPAELDTAAVEVIRRVNPDEFTTRCEARVRGGRTDPYRVALEVLAEMADG